jgi:hypothetical protein
MPKYDGAPCTRRARRFVFSGIACGGIVAVRLAAGLIALLIMAAHPRRDFWMFTLLCDFAFTATSFFAGAEKRKQKLRCGVSARQRTQEPVAAFAGWIEGLLRRRDPACASPPRRALGSAADCCPPSEETGLPRLAWQKVRQERLYASVERLGRPRPTAALLRPASRHALPRPIATLPCTQTSP